MAAVRPAFYRELLTPALHRRFTGAALLVLAVCYVEGILISEKTSFIWSWFPLGSAGIRALLLFMSGLAVFILRVSALHLGSRCSPSPSTTFLKGLFQLSTLETFGWYIASAWWFSEIYIWSSPVSSSLGWLTSGNAFERGKLNERPIYLRSVFLLFAITQSLLHLYYDIDHLRLPIEASKDTVVVTESQGVQTWLIKRLNVLKPMFNYDPNDSIKSVTHNIFLRTAVISLTAPFIYSLFIRRTAWEVSRSIASLLWNLPAQRLSFVPPHYPSLIYRSMTAGVQLLFIWESSNAFFSAYVSRQPIKKGIPLSSTSTDPNGTLLSGLKSKKELPKTFATWELSLITSNYPDRRVAIFKDIDRPSGAAWDQILSTSLLNITSINERIQTFLAPPPSQTAVPANGQTIESLPRISTPLRKDNILTKPPPPTTSLAKIESDIGSLAKSYGQSPNPGTLKLPTLSPKTKSTLKSNTQPLLSAPSAQKLLTSAPAESFSKGGFRSLIQDYTHQLLSTRFGFPFRQTFARRISSIILGTPNSSLYTILCSSKALAALAVASLNEDPFGKVQDAVPTLIRTYTETITTIEAFVKNLSPHWTDVDFRERDRRVEDVEVVVRCLKVGLGEMIEAFGQYERELKIGRENLDAARKAAKMDEVEIEMAELRKRRGELEQASLQRI